MMYVSMLFLSITIGTTIGIIILRSIMFIWNYWNRKQFKWETDNGRNWAIITGQLIDGGVGYEFARQLALKGYNLMILNDDPPNLLQEKKQLIQRECPFVQIRIMFVNFRRCSNQKLWTNIRKFIQLETNNVYILINNVNYYPQNNNNDNDSDDGETSSTTTTNYRDLHNANLMSTMRMTELILPSMISNHNGLIINITSIISLQNGPTISYSSSKVRKFQFNFSQKKISYYYFSPFDFFFK